MRISGTCTLLMCNKSWLDASCTGCSADVREDCDRRRNVAMQAKKFTVFIILRQKNSV